MDFNSDSHYLGKLCLRGHDYNKTGKSIRYKSTRGCAICAVRYCKDHPDYGYKDGKSVYHKNYREKNRERMAAQQKAWAQKNKRHKATLQKANFSTPEYRERHKKEMMYKRLFLADEYVSSILYSLTGVWIIEPKMIQAKREQLTLTREIRKAKEIANGDDSNRNK